MKYSNEEKLSIVARYQQGERITALSNELAISRSTLYRWLKSFPSDSIGKPLKFSYKLKLNHGDLKATQGDTGHAQIDMITSVYAHILDEDRKINAQKFESAFYANPDLRSVRPPEEPKEPAPATLDLEALVEQLRKSPELANTLAALLVSALSEK